MKYFFIGTSGDKYGPYDIDTLERLINEGRILENSTLTDMSETYYEAKDILPHMFNESKEEEIFIELKNKKKQKSKNNHEDLSDISIELENNHIPYRQGRQKSNPNSFSYEESSFRNDSGEGAVAQLPAELEGLNWGAFFLPLFWCINHNVIWGIFFQGAFFSFMFLLKGNEMAWQNRRFESIEQFKTIQKKWFLWGLGLELLVIVIWVAAIIALVALLRGELQNPLKDLFNGYGMAYE